MILGKPNTLPILEDKNPRSSKPPKQLPMRQRRERSQNVPLKKDKGW
uniref:Uncharacterized protein n=1 Tax=Rhizophora mucronata TaxID=61149 RepID=A0A2P2PYV5_RHIMU